MLASIRQKTTGWVAYLIVGLITVPFALFGINQLFEGQTNITVASVDGDEIQKAEYIQIFDRQKRALQEQFGDSYSQTMDNSLRQRTIESLINNKLFEKFANDLNLVTTNNEIKSEILSDENFFTDGKFNLQSYKDVLRINGYTPERYEILVAKQKNISQIKNNLLSSEFLTELETKQLNELINQERKIAYIVLKNSDFSNQVSISANEIQKTFTKNKASFTNPKKVKVDFIELNTKILEKDIKVDQDELLTFYNESKENLTVEGKRRASHILIENKDQAQEVLDKLSQGIDFVKLVSEYSIDSSTSKSGGDLGFFGKGVMVAEFEKQAFLMKKGEISNLIKTQFGYHIIKLTDIQEEAVQSFDEAKDELIKEYKANKAQQQMFELNEKIQTMAYEGSLEDIADELNLTIQVSEFFNQNTKKYDKKFITASFNGAVINKGDNSVVEIDNNRIIVLRKNQFVEASIQTLEQATPAITKQLMDAKTQALSISNAKQIISSKQGDWSDEKWITRTDTDTPLEIVNFAFTIKKPIVSATYKYKTLNDRVIIIKTTELRIQDKDNDLRSLIGNYNDEVFNNILLQLKRQAEVKIYRNQL